MDISYRSDALERTSDVPKQTRNDLSHYESLSVADDIIQGRHAVLLDDVTTPGSSKRAAIRQLTFFFFFQKPFITSMPHRQSWFHGTYDNLTNTLSYCYAISTYNSQTTVTNGIHILTLHQSQASSSLRFRRRPIPPDSNAMTSGGPYT